MIGVAVLLGGPVAAILAGKDVAVGGLFAGVGLLAAILSRLDQVVSLSAFGIQATLDRAQAAADEATAKAAEMRELALTAARLFSLLATNQMRLDGAATTERLTADALEELLQMAKATPEQRKHVLAMQRFNDSADAVDRLKRALVEAVPDREDEVNALIAALLSHEDAYVAPAAEFRAVVRDLGVTTSAVAAALSEIEAAPHRPFTPRRATGGMVLG